MSAASDRSRTFLGWLSLFGVLLLAALLLFAATSWIEGVQGAFRHGLYLWLTRLDTESALATLSNAAEVVAAVLAIAITVVAIVVELAANRYTHRITQLFVREPANAVVMGFFVLTAVQCLWVSGSLDGGAPENVLVPFAGVAISMGMVTLCLLILLPYFAYVFAFLSPLNVVERIRRHAHDAIRRAHGRPAQSAHLRHKAIEGIEELEDVALNAMEHKDRSVSMASVEALGRLLRDYQSLRAGLPASWFRIDGRLEGDQAFVSLAPVLLDEIGRHRTWFETKVLREYHSLLTQSLNHMGDVSSLIALNTRRAARAAARRGERAVFDLAVRFFNTYLRAAINGKDVRAAYHVLHQYRLLAEECVATGDDSAVRIARHFRYYGLLGYTEALPFLLEAVAYDLAMVVERAVEDRSPLVDSLLGEFLRVDREGESRAQEQRLRGVRRAQVQLATFLLARGDEKRARRIYEDMADERAERLSSIRDELRAEREPLFWELTDRGVNFGYLPPDQRDRLHEFFSWFGDRLPPVIRPSDGE